MENSSISAVEYFLSTSAQNSTTDNATSSATSESIRAMRNLAMGLVRYGFPLIILAGTVGNLLSLIVLRRKRMRYTSIYFYLLVLAVADMLVLYASAFKTWIRLLTGFELLHFSHFSCKSTMFVLLLSQHLSAWLIVAVTFDRFMAVWMPFKAPSICSVARAKVIVLILTIVLVIYNSHVFWTIKLYEVEGRPYCQAEKGAVFKILDYLKLASYSVVPFILVLVLNIAIIVSISRSTTLIGHLQAAAQEKLQRQQKVTYMLLTISFTFLLLTGPFTLFFLIAKDKREEGPAVRNLLIKTVCFLLMYCNHSINFYLYCITGKKFRKELNGFMCALCRHRGEIKRRSSQRTYRTPIGLQLTPVRDAIAMRDYNGRGHAV